jgi:phosphoadenosine phosphosulfate reductase
MDGTTLFRFKIDFHKLKLSSVDSIESIKSKLKNHKFEKEEEIWSRIKRGNKRSLTKKEKDAIKFIRKTAAKYKNRSKVISFSGGKDSSVTAILVKKALKNVPLFFSDTTLEFPETYKFVEFFSKKYNFKMIKDENNEFFRSSQDFFDLCTDLGPPSISYRWCCSVFKAYPVNKFYKTTDKNFLAFDGIRKYESQRRTKYNKVSSINKIPRQIAAYPIFLWRELDVWSYILTNRIAYNPIYELGHTRVGCWVCPNASPTNCFFRRLTHPEMWKKFETTLENYAEKYGKNKNWIIENYWRLRRSKKDKITAVTPCERYSTDQFFVYKLSEPFNEHMLEYFKPFGNVKIENADMVRRFSVGSKNPFELSGIVDGLRLKLSTELKDPNEGKKLFERQLVRALNCVNCGGCVGKCPEGAINIVNNKFTIDSEKCLQCKKCVLSDCIALNYRTEQKVIYK